MTADMKKILLCFLLLTLTVGANAQSVYDTTFVKDYASRILWSYFQEYRSIGLDIEFDDAIFGEETADLGLNSGQSLYSGLLLQYKASSIYLAGSLPQSEADILENGTRESNIWKVAVQLPGVGFRLQRAHFKGFSPVPPDDASLGDSLTTRFYPQMEANLLTGDVKYYPAFRRFAQGLPDTWNLHQVKSKAALGYRLGYHHLQLQNDSAFVQVSASDAAPVTSTSSINYGSMNFTVGPSFYWSEDNGFFAYGDLWLGLETGRTVRSAEDFSSTVWSVSFVAPEMRIAAGYQSRKWLAAIYYTYQGNHIQMTEMNINATLHTFGIILGFRTNSPARWLF